MARGRQRQGRRREGGSEGENVHILVLGEGRAGEGWQVLGGSRLRFGRAIKREESHDLLALHTWEKSKAAGCGAGRRAVCSFMRGEAEVFKSC